LQEAQAQAHVAELQHFLFQEHVLSRRSVAEALWVVVQ